MPLPDGYGVTTAGFVVPSLDVILGSIEFDFQSEFGAAIDLSSTSNFGQLAGGMTQLVNQLWQLGLAIYTAQTAEGAYGTAEDSVNALTGCIRLAATQSQVTEVLTGTASTVITLGSIVSTGGANANQFQTTTAATLAAATAWAANHVYAVGAIVTNSSNIYYAVVNGTSASSGGPTGTSQSISDGPNTLVWAYAGAGAASATVVCDSVNTGPIAGPAASLTTIVTPISGWSGAWNPAAAVLGNNVETDSAYRLRRNNELGAEGLAYLNAIQAAVLAVDADTPNAVTACTVFENYTDETVNGMPPHSIECLVQGGLDLDVATAIFNTVAAGIQPFGQTNTVTETVYDSVGNPHTVQFSRPTAIPIYVIINVTCNPNSPNFPPTDVGSMTSPATRALIATQIATAGNGLGAGFSIDQSLISAQAFIANVGAWQVTSCYVGTAPSPVGSEVVITQRQLATFMTTGGASGQIIVNVTQTVP